MGQRAAYSKSHATVQIGRIAAGLVEVGMLLVVAKAWGNRVIKRYQ